MAEYIGRRIVPTHGGVWNETKEYEELTIVLDEESGDSYISRIPVPSGTALDDEEYWMLFSIYSEQIQEALDAIEETSEELKEYVNTTATSLTEYVQETAEDLSDQVTEATKLTTANTEELTERMDTIEARQDANASASTDSDADYAAEVVDARVSSSGTTYESLYARIAAVESGESLLDNAVAPNQAQFMELSLEYEMTDGYYISYKTGALCEFGGSEGYYEATQDYVPFPYAGATIIVYEVKSTASSDMSGLALYDEDYNVLLCVDYERDTGFTYTEFTCPENTAYMRFTTYTKKAGSEAPHFWLKDLTVTTGLLVDGSVTQEKLAKNAVDPQNASFLEITPELEWTADQYIVYSSGKLNDYTNESDVYFATADYLEFPYAGVPIILQCAKSTSSNDASGIAFYDEDKVFISGSDYNRDSGGLELTEIDVPEGTVYMRLTCRGSSYLSGVKIWLSGEVVPGSLLNDGSVTEDKLADASVSEDKLAEDAVTTDKIADSQIESRHMAYLDITPEMEFTADCYIKRANGALASYTSGTNVYFATEDYVEFPYAGATCVVCSRCSTASSDASGLALYDEEYNFLMGVDYANETTAVTYTEFTCPEGTAYMRMTYYKESTADQVKIWYAGEMIPTQRIVDGAVTGDKIAENAVDVLHVSFLECTPELEWTDCRYISYSNGKLCTYSTENTYYATVDYVSFPYGGATIILRCVKSTASSDMSGIAFYDADQSFISGSDYNRDSSGLELTTITCPEGTEYIRLTCKGSSYLDSVKIWYAADTVPEGRIADSAVTEGKIADGAVTLDKLGDDVLASLENKYTVLGDYVPDDPLEMIKETPGFLSIFHTVGCIGDSLASGEAVSSEKNHDLYDYSWGQCLARMTGNTYYNWSKGGLSTSSFLSSSYATECYDGDHLCEAYLIGLAQNDSNVVAKTDDQDYEGAIGTIDDVDFDDYSNNADTFYGRYAKIIQMIQEIQPKGKIFVMTDPLTSTETRGLNAAIRELAGSFDNVYLMDLYTYGSSLYTTGLLGSYRRSGHYNAAGYFICACIIATYIDWIVKAYPEEFREVEFIGTDYSYYDTDDDDDEEASG